MARSGRAEQAVFQCDGCDRVLDGTPEQVVDVFDGTEYYCAECSELTPNNDLRKELGEELEPYDDIDGSSRFCPNCGRAGIPTSSDYRQFIVKCVTPACPVFHFRADREDEVSD
jgi:hypothetical protein